MQFGGGGQPDFPCAGVAVTIGGDGMAYEFPEGDQLCL